MNGYSRSSLKVTILFAFAASLGMTGECQDTGFTPSCRTTWFDEEFGVGFNPPSGFIGPTVTGGGLTFRWSSPDSSTLTSFSVLPVFHPTLEENVSAVVQRTADGFPGDTTTIMVNEPFLLNSGQDGWLFVYERSRDDSSRPTISVETFVRLGPGSETWIAGGFGFADEVDAEYLLNVVRSLCVERVEN